MKWMTFLSLLRSRSLTCFKIFTCSYHPARQPPPVRLTDCLPPHAAALLPRLTSISPCCLNLFLFLTILTATSLCVWWSRQRHTCPNEPLPRLPRIS